MSSPQRENDDYDEEEAPVRSLPPKMAMKAPRRDDAPVAREVDGDDEEGEGEELGDEDDDDEEDDDDDEDDEEDEEDEGEDARGRRRRAKKQKRNRFLDVEAEVDDDEEDLDEEEEELAKEDGFIEEDVADDTDDHRRRAAADNQRLDRFRREEEDQNVEALAAELRERYGRSGRYAAQSDYAEVPQRLLMPSVDDPNLWGVPCKPGRERELVISLMRKALQTSYTSNPTRIISAFFRDSIPGKIYVEARKSDDVIAACTGLVGAYARQSSSLYLVPIGEMADLLKIQKVQHEIQIGGWVRIKRGKYAGDLAQVLDITENGEEVGLKFIPRIDLNPKDADTYTDNTGKKRKKGAGAGAAAVNFRPPQRFFNADEVIKAYPREKVMKRGNTWLFANDSFKNGYLEKDIKINGIVTENVNPTLDEITKFAGESAPGIPGEDSASKPGGVDLSLIADAAKKASEVVLQPGDHVEVFEGEQAGVQGIIDAVSGEVVTISIEHEELFGQRVEVQARSVRKKFKPGDHIKVMTGKHADETGMVVKVEENITTFLSDLSLSEVSVFSKDIREAAEVGSGVNVIGDYELHNLVQLDAQTAGVIFKIERDAFRVLDQTGQVSTVRPHQISMRRDTGRAIALDSTGTELRAGDMVREVEGEQRKGQVLHVYQSMVVWLHNREYPENGGVFIARARQLAPQAPKNVSGTSSKGDLSKMNPALTANPYGAPPSGGMSGAANGGGIGRGRGGRDNLAGKSVAIIKGPYKTYRGIIKDTNGAMARVELHTMSKILTIGLDSLVEKDPITGKSTRLSAPMGPPGGNRGGYNGMGAGAHNPYAAGPNPYQSNPYGGATPAGGAMGSRTPAYAMGSRTPAYMGSKTPAYNPSSEPYDSAWAAGSKTPAYRPNDGGRTPAWNAGSKTPMPASMGGATPAWNPNADYDDDAATPAAGGGGYGSSSMSYDSRRGAPTPGAPTPGAPTPRDHPYGAPTLYGAAPTPGGWGAPTPGAPTPGGPGGWGAPTPGPGGFGAPTPAGAPTPGGYGAPTPAAHLAATPAAAASTPWAGGAQFAPRSRHDSPRDKLIAGILVKIVTDASGLSYQSGMYDDSRGEVREVSASGQSCKVLLDTGATIDEVPVSCVEPIRPRNMRETCIVTSGLWTGRKVVTLSNDGGEWMCTLPDGSSGVLEGGQMALAA